jgi:hypothetical protein
MPVRAEFIRLNLRSYWPRVVAIGLGAAGWVAMYHAPWFQAIRNTEKQGLEWLFLLATVVALVASIRSRWFMK